MFNSDLPSISTMADNSKLIKWLNNKFDEIGEQLTLNGNTMICIEKEMSGRISTNKERRRSPPSRRWQKPLQPQ